MKTQRFSVGSLAWLFLLGATLFGACHLDQGEKTENTLSFTKHYETLSQFDEVSIAVVDPSTGDTTIIFRGKVDVRGEIEKLDVPGWDGGPIIIVVSGFKAGSAAPVFVEEKKYDGRSRTTDSILVHVSPNPGITATSLTLQLSEGQILPLPQVTIAPDNLADSGIVWSSDRPEVAAIRDGALEAVSPGTAQVTARLHYDAAKSVTFTVTVQPDPTAPHSLALDRDTLFLAQHGSPGAFGIDVKPATAKAEVTWTLSDSSIAGLRADGSFQGLLPGLTRAIAASKSRPGLRDTAYIRVSEPVLVQAVRFVTAPVTLYIGGTPQTLEVEVLPAKANQDVLFSLTDSTKANLNGTTLGPRQVGTLSVIVRSKENPSKSDTLQVTIKQPVQVQSVAASADTLTLYVRGPGRTLTAQVLPDSAPQGLRWVSLTPGVASVNALTGQVEPGTPGLALVVAASQADSSRKDTVQVSVKLDIPHLTAGPDTAVSAGQTVLFHPTATQEYGQVVMFKWDLDGDQAWEDSATTLKDVSHLYSQAKVYRARLFVRDTEGNEVTVYRLVTVVSSAAVTIEEPKDNTYTNKRTVPVVWYVNNVKQESQATADLVPGPNEIVRTAKDSAGKAFTVKVTVHLDTAAPQKPILAGTSPTNTKPKWTWSTGGEGSGDFRYRLGDGNFPADALSTRDTAYTLAADPVSGATYTLFVQERDQAGNWSPASTLAIVFDMTKPVVAITSPQASGTHFTSSSGLVLSGTAGGPLPIARVTYKVGAAAAMNATFASGAWSTPSFPLQAGVSTAVLVTAIDNAGNTGEASITLFMDNTAPSAPDISVGPPATTATLNGTFGWTAGGDGTSGSGLNGRYRYNINGGPWKDTSTALLTDLPLFEGINVFSVQEQDRALLWSASATRIVKGDTTDPTLTLTSHANPVTHPSTSITLSGQVRDTGTGLASLTVSGQASGSGTVTVNGTNWSTAALTLASGQNTLVLTATDGVGNVRTLNAVVNVNVPAPVVIITLPSDNTTLTNKDTITVWYTIEGTAGSQKFSNLTEGVNSLVVASVANISGNIGRDTVRVTRDATPPLSPTLSRGTTPTNGNGTWSWVSRGDNANGSGVKSPAAFRYSLDGGQTFTETPSTQHQISTQGTWTLVVQEQDKAGNWSSSSASQTVEVDKSGPLLEIITRDNFITNKSQASIRYKMDGAEQSAKLCTLTVSNGSNTCIVKATDPLGNPSQSSITVWYRPTTWFLTPTGSGSGTSWDDASSNLRGMLADNEKSGHELWLGTGSFTADLFSNQPMKVLGGFDAANQPYSTSNRNKTGTSLRQLLGDFSSDLTVDGVVLTEFILRIGKANLNDVTFSPIGEVSSAISVTDGGTVSANNVTISQKTYTNAIVSVWYSNANFSGGSIVGNTAGGSFGISMAGSSKVHLSGAMNLYGNSSPFGTYQISVGSGAELTIDPGVNTNCYEVYNDGGTVSCKK